MGYSVKADWMFFTVSSRHPEEGWARRMRHHLKEGLLEIRDLMAGDEARRTSYPKKPDLPDVPKQPRAKL